MLVGYEVCMCREEIHVKILGDWIGIKSNSSEKCRLPHNILRSFGPYKQSNSHKLGIYNNILGDRYCQGLY